MKRSFLVCLGYAVLAFPALWNFARASGQLMLTLSMSALGGEADIPDRAPLSSANDPKQTNSLREWGHQALLIWDFRVHDRRDHGVHMIFVAQQTVLTRRALVVTGLAEILLHLAETRHEILRIALLVALQIAGLVFCKVVAG